MSNPSSNKPIKQSWLSPGSINKLTPQEALILAQHKFRAGDLVETPLGGTFVVSDTPHFEYVAHHNCLYISGMTIFDFDTGQWAKVIQRGSSQNITKDQKEHILNLIKSI
ncbi:MAG: hypothetical protein E6R13_06355 [Spirochaetes bacterium]|nr:MAG: hypothetical protein E6R13_06355 [Spirochaetota bacterium]